MYSSWLTYYIAVGLFTAGMAFGCWITDETLPSWRNWVGIILSGLLWPLLVLYILLYQKYHK